jgi:hypothetical protein
MNVHRPWLLLLLSAAASALPAQADANRQDPERLERLRRDQDEILRKAERLQSMMQRLQQRYERENKPEQVRLLREGLAHLEQSGILKEIAGIRDDLVATAFTEAMRKQREVVDDLERLLNILLERKSIENLDQDLRDVAEQAANARELERRQRQLRDATRETLRTPPSPAEQQLADSLQQLRDAERTEADRNRRQAGTRRPFLESALDAVRGLLDDQQRLEQGLADEAAGKAPASRAREFDLGDLHARTRELQNDLRDQRRTAELGAAARNLRQEAAGTDAGAAQQARDRFEAETQDAPKVAAGPEGKQRDPAWAELRADAQKAAALAGDAQRAELARIGETGERLAAERQQAAGEQNGKTGAQLRDAAKALAERMQAATSAPPDAADDPAAAVAEAAERLDEAAAASRAQENDTAARKANEALAALDRARAAHQRQHPDADRRASEMAADATAAASELANAPSAAEPEQQAAEALRQASQALRDVERAGNRPDDQPPASGERQASAGRSRERLEQARRDLEGALTSANQDGQQDMQAAAARQQDLAEQAKAAAEQLQRAAEDGSLTAAQADRARQGLQQARQSMQTAGERLQQGQQASAAGEQQRAAEQLQQAMDALAENRPPNAERRDQLAQQARAQQQLAEDIVRLAEELKQRENQQAQRHAEQAADAAKKAQQAMEQGEAEETMRQQEAARQELEQAAKELQQEEERYRDLRQEELLFRMKDELTTFLDKQRPITAETVQAAKATTAEGLPRAARRKMNQLGEEEIDLGKRIDTLVAALTEEGNLVYRTVLVANAEDLREIGRRLAGRNPDVGSFTTLLQQDTERRAEELLAALDAERQRREQERKERQQQQQQQQQGQNRFNPQRKKLVGLIAELEMLKRLGIDTRKAADNLQTLIEVRGDETIADAEVALLERLGHRHAEITRLFQQIKAGIDETMQQMQNQETPDGGSGR